MSDRERLYRVYGLMQSFFTRKITGYLDYKGIPWVLRRFGGFDPAVLAAGWPGGVPAVQAPDGAFMWDTTAIVHHLERRFPARAVLPDDPVQRFLCYAIEDFSDEWLYRPAVGSRWHYEANHSVGGWELARDIAADAPLSCDQAYAAVGAHVRASCPPLGVTEATIGAWVDEVLKPWQRVFAAHLATAPYLFGARPSLADFALFGGNAAHFVNDPLCRRWTEAEGPAVVEHTHRLLEPARQSFGDWMAVVPETLIALLAEIGRLYLPWVSRAAIDGSAELVFSNGVRITIAATPFLVDARAVLLARYAALRSAALDATLERAGILRFFADFAERAGAIPDDREPPRPSLNRPFPPLDA
jgi:glutathione S-transferase